MESKKYIPNIHHYCDSWCEKCPFTQRCEYFAKHKDPLEGFADSNEDQEFWDQFLHSLKYTKQLVKQHSTKSTGKYKVYPAALKEKMKREKAAQHDCTLLADQYLKMVDDWLTDQQDFIHKIQNMSGKSAFTDKKNIMLKDCIEVIKWYQPQVYVKLSRAVYLMMNDEVDESEETFTQGRDPNGTAKISIIGIERSIAAWGNMMEITRWQEDWCLEILIVLDKLLKSVEQHFPSARSFIRPGFDE